MHFGLQLWRINETTFNLRVFNKQFVGLKDQSQDGKIVAISTTPGPAETFQIVRNENDPYRIRLRASNGLFLQVFNFFNNNPWFIMETTI